MIFSVIIIVDASVSVKEARSDFLVLHFLKFHCFCSKTTFCDVAKFGKMQKVFLVLLELHIDAYIILWYNHK